MNEKMKNALTGMKVRIAQAGTAVAGLGVSAMALASPASPGAAVAGELGTGKADVMLVIGAAAVIIGALILWSYVKKAR